MIVEKGTEFLAGNSFVFERGDVCLCEIKKGILTDETLQTVQQIEALLIWHTRVGIVRISIAQLQNHDRFFRFVQGNVVLQMLPTTKRIETVNS